MASLPSSCSSEASCQQEPPTTTPSPLPFQQFDLQQSQQQQQSSTPCNKKTLQKEIDQYRLRQILLPILRYQKFGTDFKNISFLEQTYDPLQSSDFKNSNARESNKIHEIVENWTDREVPYATSNENLTQNDYFLSNSDEYHIGQKWVSTPDLSFLNPLTCDSTTSVGENFLQNSGKTKPIITAAQRVVQSLSDILDLQQNASKFPVDQEISGNYDNVEYEIFGHCSQEERNTAHKSAPSVECNDYEHDKENFSSSSRMYNYADTFQDKIEFDSASNTCYNHYMPNIISYAESSPLREMTLLDILHLDTNKPIPISSRQSFAEISSSKTDLERSENLSNDINDINDFQNMIKREGATLLLHQDTTFYNASTVSVVLRSQKNKTVRDHSNAEVRNIPRSYSLVQISDLHQLNEMDAHFKVAAGELPEVIQPITLVEPAPNTNRSLENPCVSDYYQEPFTKGSIVDGHEEEIDFIDVESENCLSQDNLIPQIQERNSDVFEEKQLLCHSKYSIDNQEKLLLAQTENTHHSDEKLWTINQDENSYDCPTYSVDAQRCLRFSQNTQPLHVVEENTELHEQNKFLESQIDFENVHRDFCINQTPFQLLETEQIKLLEDEKSHSYLTHSDNNQENVCKNTQIIHSLPSDEKNIDTHKKEGLHISQVAKNLQPQCTEGIIVTEYEEKLSLQQACFDDARRDRYPKERLQLHYSEERYTDEYEDEQSLLFVTDSVCTERNIYISQVSQPHYSHEEMNNAGENLSIGYPITFDNTNESIHINKNLHTFYDEENIDNIHKNENLIECPLDSNQDSGNHRFTQKLPLENSDVIIGHDEEVLIIDSTNPDDATKTFAPWNLLSCISVGATEDNDENEVLSDSADDERPSTVTHSYESNVVAGKKLSPKFSKIADSLTDFDFNHNPELKLDSDLIEFDLLHDEMAHISNDSFVRYFSHDNVKIIPVYDVRCSSLQEVKYGWLSKEGTSSSLNLSVSSEVAVAEMMKTLFRTSANLSNIPITSSLFSQKEGVVTEDITEEKQNKCTFNKSKQMEPSSEICDVTNESVECSGAENDDSHFNPDSNSKSSNLVINNFATESELQDPVFLTAKEFSHPKYLPVTAKSLDESTVLQSLDHYLSRFSTPAVSFENKHSEINVDAESEQFLRNPVRITEVLIVDTRRVHAMDEDHCSNFTREKACNEKEKSHEINLLDFETVKDRDCLIENSQGEINLYPDPISHATATIKDSVQEIHYVPECASSAGAFCNEENDQEILEKILHGLPEFDLLNNLEKEGIFNIGESQNNDQGFECPYSMEVEETAENHQLELSDYQLDEQDNRSSPLHQILQENETTLEEVIQIHTDSCGLLDALRPFETDENAELLSECKEILNEVDPIGRLQGKKESSITTTEGFEENELLKENEMVAHENSQDKGKISSDRVTEIKQDIRPNGNNHLKSLNHNSSFPQSPTSSEIPKLLQILDEIQIPAIECDYHNKELERCRSESDLSCLESQTVFTQLSYENTCNSRSGRYVVGTEGANEEEIWKLADNYYNIAANSDKQKNGSQGKENYSFGSCRVIQMIPKKTHPKQSGDESSNSNPKNSNESNSHRESEHLSNDSSENYTKHLIETSTKMEDIEKSSKINELEKLPLTDDFKKQLRETPENFDKLSDDSIGKISRCSSVSLEKFEANIQDESHKMEETGELEKFENFYNQVMFHRRYLSTLKVVSYAFASLFHLISEREGEVYEYPQFQKRIDDEIERLDLVIDKKLSNYFDESKLINRKEFSNLSKTKQVDEIDDVVLSPVNQTDLDKCRTSKRSLSLDSLNVTTKRVKFSLPSSQAISKEKRKKFRIKMLSNLSNRISEAIRIGSVSKFSLSRKKKKASKPKSSESNPSENNDFENNYLDGSSRSVHSPSFETSSCDELEEIIEAINEISQQTAFGDDQDTENHNFAEAINEIYRNEQPMREDSDYLAKEEARASDEYAEKIFFSDGPELEAVDIIEAVSKVLQSTGFNKELEEEKVVPGQDEIERLSCNSNSPAETGTIVEAINTYGFSDIDENSIKEKSDTKISCQGFVQNGTKGIQKDVTKIRFESGTPEDISDDGVAHAVEQISDGENQKEIGKIASDGEEINISVNMRRIMIINGVVIDEDEETFV